MRIVFGVIVMGLVSFQALGQQPGDTIPVRPDHWMARVGQFKKEKVVKEKIVFLGDGFIEKGGWKKLLKDSSVINRGIDGDISSATLQRIGDIISRQPSKLFLMIGFEDMAKGLPDEVIFENVFSLVRKIKRDSPKTLLYVNSLLPVNATAKNFKPAWNKTDHIIVVNEQLQKYAERLGYVYVNVYDGFLDRNGHLDPAVSTDGVHLLPAGYVRWVEILRKANCL